MSQCVPSWDIDETPLAERLSLHSNPSSTEFVTSSGNPTLDYEVAELTWENGQLAMHGLGLPRLATGKSAVSKYTWEKPRASGTLESIVNQATQSTPPCKSDSELLPWFNHHQRNAIPASTTIVMDALVPCTKPTNPNLSTGTCVNGNTTLVESSSAGVPTKFNTRTKDVVEEEIATKRERLGTTREEGSSRIHSVMESRHVGVDMDMDLHLDVGFTSTSLGSQDNTSMSTGKPLRSYTNGNMSYTNGNTFDDHDSLSHSRPQEIGAEEDKKNEKSSVSTKRSRAAAIHNQSERKRRDKINQRMKTLQKLVPNSNKTDKASMLDEVIEYLKQLQAQVQVMSRMSIPPMMIPMNMQQQFQMAMMAQMGMGMSMGMGMGVMDLNSIGRPNIPSIPPIINPAAFMSMASWDGTGDRVAPSATILPDPMANFLACQSQPMNMDAYTKMAALYQQMHQQQFSNSKT